MMVTTANFVAAKASTDQYESMMGSELSKNQFEALIKIFETQEM